MPLPQLPHVGASKPHGVLAAPGPGPRPARQSGIALLEALIAIVILGIGLLGMIGLAQGKWIEYDPTYTDPRGRRFYASASYAFK